MSDFNLSLTTTCPASILCAALRPTRLKALSSVTRPRIIPTSVPWPVLFPVPERSHVPPSHNSRSRGAGRRAFLYIQSGERRGEKGGGAGFKGRAKKFAQGSFCVPGESLESPSLPHPAAAGGTRRELNSACGISNEGSNRKGRCGSLLAPAGG